MTTVQTPFTTVPDPLRDTFEQVLEEMARRVGEVYGVEERDIARYLERHRANLERTVVATLEGRSWEQWPESVRRSRLYEAVLRRLHKSPLLGPAQHPEARRPLEVLKALSDKPSLKELAEAADDSPADLMLKLKAAAGQTLHQAWELERSRLVELLRQLRLRQEDHQLTIIHDGEAVTSVLNAHWEQMSRDEQTEMLWQHVIGYLLEVESRLQMGSSGEEKQTPTLSDAPGSGEELPGGRTL